MGSSQDTEEPLLRGVWERELAADAHLRVVAELFSALQTEVRKLENEHIDALVEKPEWGLLHQMFERASAHVGGCIVLFSNSHIAPAEALCRTAIEAAVNLYYCSIGDSVGHVICYFKAHIKTERAQNKTWSDSVTAAGMDHDSRDHHLLRIRDKETALRLYEQTLDQVFPQVGYSFKEASDNWPSIYDRFKAIGKEVSYRTVYAALCSQAHNDPEDLLNNFVQGVTEIEDLKEKQQAENRAFSFYMVMMALEFLIESAGIYLARFSIGMETIGMLHRGIHAELEQHVVASPSWNRTHLS
jgi:hypothetical protein